MKVKAKPECIGQTHSIYGLLSADDVYEVDEVRPDGPFVPISKYAKKNSDAVLDSADGVTTEGN
jgi:hypothetical protein